MNNTLLIILASLLTSSLFAQSEVVRPVEINVTKLVQRLQSAPDIFENSKSPDYRTTDISGSVEINI